MPVKQMIAVDGHAGALSQLSYHCSHTTLRLTAQELRHLGSSPTQSATKQGSMNALHQRTGNFPSVPRTLLVA